MGHRRLLPDHGGLRQAELSDAGGAINLNGILIGSDDPQRLTAYYTSLFGEPGWTGGDFRGWQLGSGFVTVGPHDRVQGRNPSQAG